MLRKYHKFLYFSCSDLHLAIIHNLNAETEQIINYCPDAKLLDLQNKEFQTALHLTILLNLPILTSLLVMKGANLDIRDKHGNTALHLACKHGNIECVEALLSSRKMGTIFGYRNIPQHCNLRNYSGSYYAFCNYYFILRNFLSQFFHMCNDLC